MKEREREREEREREKERDRDRTFVPAIVRSSATASLPFFSFSSVSAPADDWCRCSFLQSIIYRIPLYRTPTIPPATVYLGRMKRLSAQYEPDEKDVAASSVCKMLG